MAMRLRVQLRDTEFSRRATPLKVQILAVMDQPAQHWSIRRIQATFQATSDRHYYWAADRQIPAENNLIGRDLHLTVILVG